MSGYDAYKKASIDDNSPQQNVVLLLNRIIQNCNNKNNTSNSIDILCFLEESLNYEVNKEFCENLASVYTFCIKQLLLYRLNGNSDITETVKNVITPIREGFAGIK